MSTVVKFVDSIAAVPTTRLDLNDGVVWRTLLKGAPPPRLRRAMSQNAMTNGAFVASSAYDQRIVTLDLLLLPNTQDLNATQLQLLARELDREDNYLMYQPNGLTKPVFFRVLRSDYSRLGEVDGQPTARQGTIDLLCEPFAVGLREDAVVAAVVAHDPAAVTNPVSFTLNVLGDVETEPIVWFTSAFSGNHILVSQANDDAVVLVQAESASSLNTDTSLNANDAAFSGAGQNSFRTTFATPALTTRADYAALTRPGTYRVFMRCRSTTAVGPPTFEAQITSLGMSTMDVTEFAGTALFQMVDLGLVTTPKGDGRIGFNTNPLPSVNTFTLSMARTAGSGSLDVDYLLFIPADEHSTITALANSRRYVFDATRDQLLLISTASTPFTATAVDHITAGSGSMPALIGGRVNRIFLVQLMDNTAISATLTVSLSYYPRYLYIRPSAT